MGVEVVAVEVDLATWHRGEGADGVEVRTCEVGFVGGEEGAEGRHTWALA